MPYALLVDDDEHFAQGLAQVVALENFTTRTARTLGEARKLLAQGPPDVLLVDVNLPDGSGLELLSDMAGSATTEVVLVTAEGTVETAVEAMRRGATDYLTKPVDLERVRKVLAGVTHTHELRRLASSMPWGSARRHAPVPAAAPDQFGRYEVRDEIGEGAMGRVFRAHDPLVGRTVAIKTVRPEYLTRDTREEYLRRFRREAQAAGILSHPHIVQIYDVAEDYIVMEYVEGVTLEELLRHQPVLDRASALRILSPLAEALDYAHQAGVIHRDIKPANVMVQPDGRPKLMDFGIARLDTGSVTDTGHFFGSPSYMAPEQVLSGEASARSDLYSFGVVAYEALAGQRPFHADSVATVIYRVVNDPPPAPSTLNASLSSSDDEAFARALAKQPAQRFPTAREFARALVSDASIPADISFEPLLEALLSMPPTVVSDAPPLAAEPAARTPVTASRPPASPDAQATIGLEQGVPRPGRGARGAWLAAGALVLALAGASLVRDGSDAPPPAASGNRALPALRVETDPADALVSVDGAERGRSPLMLSGLSPGRHEVRVAAAGFAPAAVAVEVRPGVPAPPLRFILSPLGGFLSVRSEPAGATVRVDGAVVGSTPLSSVLVEPGRREILLEHAGYLAQMEVVEAQAGRAHEVSARMVASAPRAARVQPPAPVRPREPLPVPAATAPALFTGALVPLDESVVAPRRTFGEPAGYPEAARRLRLAGSVKVEITVGSDGTAEDVRVLESAGAILDDAVVEAVRGWRFEPATKQGVRVRVRWPYRQTFKPS